jgi:hypothetical protein
MWALSGISVEDLMFKKCWKMLINGERTSTVRLIISNGERTGGVLYFKSAKEKKEKEKNPM